jgi:hypothetical protein
MSSPLLRQISPSRAPSLGGAPVAFDLAIGSDESLVERASAAGDCPRRLVVFLNMQSAFA